MEEQFNQDLVGFNQKEETPEEREAKQKNEEKKVINRVIRGINDTFIKEYKYDDIKVNFTVKIKAPNALEIGRIQSRLSAYLGGMNNYASEYVVVAFTALATLREVGIDVPKELEKDEDIYSMEILYEIGRDFQQWLNNFRF